MASITPLQGGRGLPDLTVVEFACLIALMRLGPRPAPLLLETIGEWFGQDVGLPDIKPCLRRLIHQELLVQGQNGLLRLLPKAAPPASTCLSAMIRLVGTEFQRAFEKADSPLFDRILQQVREEQAQAKTDRHRRRKPRRRAKDESDKDKD